MASGPTSDRPGRSHARAHPTVPHPSPAQALEPPPSSADQPAAWRVAAQRR